MSRPSTLAAIVLLGAVATVDPRPVSAAGTQKLEQLVILLRPPEIDELMREALARITGELAAARFRVIIVALDRSVDPIDQVEVVGRDLDPVAAFALVRGSKENAENVELWISDRLAQRTTIQRMRVQGGDLSKAAEVLAVESVELLRISMADLWPRPEAPQVVRETPPPPAPQNQASLTLGVGMLQEIGTSAPAAWAPFARVAYGRAGGLWGALALRGLGPGSDRAASEGSVRLRREAAWLELGWAFRAGSRLQPHVFLGGGADHVRAEGMAPAPARAHVRDSWGGLALGGAGLGLTVVGRLALVLDVEGMLYFPSGVVRIADADVRFDRPSVLVDAGLCARF